MDYEITKIAEFHNKELENAFFTSDIKKNLRYIRYVLLVFCLINFLWVIYDYVFLDAGGTTNIILYSLIPRSIILLFSIVYFIATRKPQSYKVLLNVVSIFVPLLYALHLYMAYHFNNVDLSFEAVDVILVILCIFLIPNRWIINVMLSIMTGVLFIVFSPFIILGMTLTVKIGLAIYHIWIIIIISLLIFRINRYKRIQYSKEIHLDILANTDPLTKTYNRLKCDNTITQMCKDELSFSIILFDIDNFKEINDTYGHIVGDKVLVEIVDTTLENIRGIDILARWGGDEFLIVLHGESLDSATKLAERLRQLIETKKFQNVPFTVTASFGVTEYLKGDCLYSIINRVDKFLYSVKTNGKNKFISD